MDLPLEYIEAIARKKKLPGHITWLMKPGGVSEDGHYNDWWPSSLVIRKGQTSHTFDAGGGSKKSAKQAVPRKPVVLLQELYGRPGTGGRSGRPGSEKNCFLNCLHVCIVNRNLINLH